MLLKSGDIMKKDFTNMPYSEIKNKFKNVYFIIGTAYAGKSTMVKMLSKHNNGIMCGENYTINVFKDYGVNLKDQPNLCYTDNHSMEEFVSRTPDEYYNWIKNCDMEVTPIEISELLVITSKYPDKKIFVDTSIPMEILKEISDYDHVAVMLSEKICRLIGFLKEMITKNKLYFVLLITVRILKLQWQILEKLNSQEIYNEFLNSGFLVFKRDDSLTLEQTMECLEKHFKLK